MQKAGTTTVDLSISMPAARLSILAGATALGALVALHVLSPEFDPASRMVSEYALGGQSWLLSIMFLAWSLNYLSLFFAIKPEVPTRGGKVGLAFLLAAVAGMTMAAFFDIRHSLHGLSALIGNPSFLVGSALVTNSLLREPTWKAARRPLLWTVALCWVSFVLLLAAMFTGLARSGGEFGPGVLLGWPNRLLVVSSCAWAMVTAWYAIQVDR